MAPDLNAVAAGGKFDYSQPGSSGYSVPDITYNVCFLDAALYVLMQASDTVQSHAQDVFILEAPLLDILCCRCIARLSRLFMAFTHDF